MKHEKQFKYRSIVGLILLYLAMWFEWQWVWGLLFIMWVIPDLISGVTYFLEPVDKKNHPILYWIIIGSWILLSLFSFSSLIFPDWKY